MCLGWTRDRQDSNPDGCIFWKQVDGKIERACAMDIALRIGADKNMKAVEVLLLQDAEPSSKQK